MELLTRTIQFPETLDEAAIAFFHQTADGAIRSDADVVLVDFTNVEFMSSPGLMALVIAFKQAREVAKPMFLQSINDRVRMLLELTGMDKVFEIMESSEAESEAEPVLAVAK
jgi:anti-sigma B factor antagonist